LIGELVDKLVYVRIMWDENMLIGGSLLP